MIFGTAAQELAIRVGFANATAGTRQGDQCRRALIAAIKQLSATPFSWNLLRADASITANLNDYTVGGGAGQALPAGTYAPRRLWYVYSSDVTDLMKVDEEQIIELEAEASTTAGSAQYWTTSNNAVHVFPVPTTNWTLRGIYYRNGTLAEGTFSGGVWTWPSDSSTSIWLDDDKGLDLTILAAAEWIARNDLKRPDLADGFRAEYTAQLPTQTTLNRARQLTGQVYSHLI
jgi:hypothetical protein